MRTKYLTTLSFIFGLLLSSCNPSSQLNSNEKESSSAVTSETTGDSHTSSEDVTSDDTPTSEDTHTHTFESGYHFDETHHWHNATCGHDVKSGYEPYNFQVTVIPPDWGVPGYTRHTCTECGYFFDSDPTAAKVHTYSSEWNHDETHHWHDCLDEGFEGKEYGANLATHSFTHTVVQPKLDRQGYTIHECECGYSYTDTPTYDSKWTSPYEINSCHGNVSDKVHTFGMVTGIMKGYIDETPSFWEYIVQCSDREGNEAAFIATEREPIGGAPYFSIGDFVEVQGTPKLVSNMVYFTNEDPNDEVQIDYLENSINYHVPTIELTSDMLSDDPESPEWNNLEKMGLVELSASITVSSVHDFSDYGIGVIFGTLGGKQLNIYYEGENITDVMNYVDENKDEDITIKGLSFLTICQSRTSYTEPYDTATINQYLWFDSINDISIGPSTSVKGVSFDITYKSLAVGETFTLTPNVYPDTAIDKSVTYHSDDTRAEVCRIEILDN